MYMGTRSFLSKIILILLIPTILSHPLYGWHNQVSAQSSSYQDPLNPSALITYDQVVQYLANIESGAVESRCNAKDFEAINSWLIYLARCGVIPGDTESESLLEIDIQELDEEDTGYEFSLSSDEDYHFSLIPMAQASHLEAFLCKSRLAKKWKQIKHFVKKHKKEILIGAAVLVAAGLVVAAVSGAMAAAATGAAAAASVDRDSSSTKASDIAEQAEAMRQDVLSKELATLQDPSFPPEENARILGQAATQAAFERLNNTVSSNSYFANDIEKMGALRPDTHHLIDQVFSQPIPWYSWGYSNNFKHNVYASRGEYALDIKSYDQALLDLGKALELNPNSSDVYLSRALTYFETGQIDKAATDFKKHVELREPPTGALKDFTRGFVEGLPRGVKDSGIGLYEFAGDLILHPISTASKMYESGQMLFELTKSAQWAEIAEALSPEAHELATQWEDLSFEKRGELSGYVFGKHGADLLIPGAGIKLLKGAAGDLKVLATAASNASKAENIYAFEATLSAPKIGTTALENTGIGLVSELLPEVKLASIQKFQQAKEYLSPYKGVYMPEAKLRNLIKEAGLEAVPRPKGIPENFRVKISKEGSGIVYVHPNHEHTSIRVMFGKPHSPWPAQQKPYVVVKKDGSFYDQFGQTHKSLSPAVHIPLEEFKIQW